MRVKQSGINNKLKIRIASFFIIVIKPGIFMKYERLVVVLQGETNDKFLQHVTIASVSGHFVCTVPVRPMSGCRGTECI